LLAAVACALCISTYPVFGNFRDEPEHIAAGLVLLERGVRQLWLGYRGTADPAREPPPPYRVLQPNQPVKGWVAITEAQRAQRVGSARTSSLWISSTGTARAFQISAQYSRMVRSEENLPQRAVLRIDMRVQRSLSR
jgi:hypothetical protein